MKNKSMADIRRINLKKWFSTNPIPPNEKSYISQLINGKSSFGEKAARRLERDYNIPESYLDNNVNTESNATIIGAVDGWDSNTPLNEDDIEVPFYKDVRLAAGNGFADDIEDYNGFKLRLSKSTMRRKGINPENVVCLSVDGDSMEPVLQDQSSVGIDKGDKNIRDGKIYAFNHDGLLRIKILENLPGNRIRIKSYNSIYTDEEVSLEDISMLGRVWWTSAILD